MGTIGKQHTKGKKEFNNLMNEFGSEAVTGSEAKNLGLQVKKSLDAFEEGNFGPKRSK